MRGAIGRPQGLRESRAHTNPPVSLSPPLFLVVSLHLCLFHLCFPRVGPPPPIIRLGETARSFSYSGSGNGTGELLLNTYRRWDLKRRHRIPSCNPIRVKKPQRERGRCDSARPAGSPMHVTPPSLSMLGCHSTDRRTPESLTAAEACNAT